MYVVYNVHAWCLWRPKEGVRYLGAGALDFMNVMWVLRTEPQSSARAASNLNYKATSPHP